MSDSVADNKTMRSLWGRRVLFALALLSVLVLGFGLRVWGSGFGLPDYTRYHHDEHALVDRAAQILWTGNWNLDRFNYPPFYAYLQAISYAGYFLWGAAQGTWSQVFPFAIPQFYQVGRVLTAVVGTATVLTVYLIGRNIASKRMGLLAAALLGGCYLHVIHSHYVTFDVMVGLMVALALLFSLLVLQRHEAKWYLLAGLCAGLAGATKYNGAIAVLIPLTAHVLATSWGEWGWLNGRLFLIVAGFVAGFFGGNPFALGNLPDFLNGLALVLHHYGTQQPGFEGTGNWRWYLGVFLTSPDSLLFVAGLVGLGGIVWRKWRVGLVTIIFPLAYFAPVSRFVVRFARNMVPLLPFLAIGAGWLVDRTSRWLGRKLANRRLWSNLFAGAGTILILLLPLLAAVGFGRLLSDTDHRQVAGEWLEENLAPGSRIAIEHYSIPINDSVYEVTDVLRIDDHDLEWYQEEGFDALIISDGVWPVLRQQPDVYGDRLSAHDELASNAELLAEFVPNPLGLVTAGYPTVAVYHYAPVRIYGVQD